MRASRCLPAPWIFSRSGTSSAHAARPRASSCEHLAVADDRVERRAQLVAHVGEEGALGAVGLLRRLLGHGELGVALLDLPEHLVEAVDEDARARRRPPSPRAASSPSRGRRGSRSRPGGGSAAEISFCRREERSRATSSEPSTTMAAAARVGGGARAQLLEVLADVDRAQRLLVPAHAAEDLEVVCPRSRGRRPARRAGGGSSATSGRRYTTVLPALSKMIAVSMCS